MKIGNSQSRGDEQELHSFEKCNIFLKWLFGVVHHLVSDSFNLYSSYGGKEKIMW